MHFNQRTHSGMPVKTLFPVQNNTRDINVTNLYSKPSDWVNLPNVNVGEQKLVGAYAVFNTDTNFVAFTCTGNYTVDWGDGNIENFNSNVQAQHQYSYSSFTDSTLCSRGYRQAIITIIPQSGHNFSTFNFDKKHTSVTNSSNIYSTQWLNIRVAGSNITSLVFKNAGVVRSEMLEIFEFIGTNSITTGFAGMFYNCYSLRNVSLDTVNGTNFSTMFYACYSLRNVSLDTVNGTDFSSMFASCYSLQTIPLLNTVNGTNFSSMFSSCSTLQTIPLLFTVNGTNFSSMFASCYSLQTIPLLFTVNGTNFSSMFANCYSLQTIPLLNTTNGTNFSNMFYVCSTLQIIPLLNTTNGSSFTNMFYMCYSLQKGTMSGTKRSINYNDCNLSKIELIDIFNNLASGVSAQIITISKNWGYASLSVNDKSIATNKGWTIA